MSIRERLTIADRHLTDAARLLKGSDDAHELDALHSIEVALSIMHRNCFGKTGRTAQTYRVDVVTRVAAARAILMDQQTNAAAWYETDRAITALVA